MSDEAAREQLGLSLGEDVDLLRFRERAGVVEAPPEAVRLTPREWMRANLFSSWFNALLTLVSLSVVALVVYQLGRFVFVGGEWEVVRVTMRGYMIGPFPIEQAWRVWASLYLVVVLGGASYGVVARPLVFTPRRVALTAVIALLAGALFTFVVQTPLVRLLTLALLVTLAACALVGKRAGTSLRRPLAIAWLLAFPAVIVIVRGFDGVSPRDWGGFFFNIVAATVGIGASFPIGILLALGRRSGLPAIRAFSIGFIELFRGVPLIAWLIFSKFVVDLLLPPQWNLPDIVKALIAFTAFSSAYVGEVVRGGLQGVHHGQYEAARALGLSPARMMGLVILPQALRSTIPAMISHFISLFKDTSLFTAIQVTEALSIARLAATNPQFLGTIKETLLFAALLFWVVAFTMSRWSQRLEVRLGVGER